MLYFHRILSSLIVFHFVCLKCVTSLTTTNTQCYPNYAHHSPEDFNSQAPGNFIVEMNVLMSGQSTPRSVKIQIVRDWSPLGADRFYALVLENYYSCAAFYRYVSNFIVQFGYAAEPDESSTWNAVIQDDAVVKSNLKGTLTFATSGSDSRSTHLFFNFEDNSFLDAQGFSPFGIVLEGFDTLVEVYNPTPYNSGGIDQGMYESGGNDWVLSRYPDVTLIESIILTDEIPSALYKGTSSSNDSMKTVIGMVAGVAGVVICAAFVLWWKKHHTPYHSVNELDRSVEEGGTWGIDSSKGEVTLEL
mmetsp:Transcript_19443/g.36240  ORF Transcript_19443/g.36240 Transcript_19443/m.36240 type:complete len:303 (+) Transcript_19443:98-1006(+)|eukprot:CAMPEP_0114423128 /NCGR_PEP_ID=MMETSP0103-20121206/5982_1 /TAXON_ID=37642 ORGANISM="Paraphysomonas imperforata, Strain PA2" /NCGR_SAMPLE_ID=MMETSP0103 /ASSEMBLY_ACC=CAM_ASM_000201 /LENGTH=302 /DNA_ID=CAMNT_0001591767 /DNA_START=38 /DNA_END=946 /DNA_ORIENTATION=-